MPSIPMPPEEESPTDQRARILGSRATKAIAGDNPNDARTVTLVILAVGGASRASGLWGIIGTVAAAMLGLDALARRRYHPKAAGTQQETGRRA